MNFDRPSLRAKGKAAFLASYWKCVLVAFILSLISGGSSGGSSAGSRGSSSGNYGGYSGDYSGSIFNALTGSVNGMGVVVAVVAILVILALAVGIALSVFVFNPLKLGCYKFFLENSRTHNASLNLLGYGFKKENYKNVVYTMFMRDLKVFLWSLLLIIPGIIAIYRYYLTEYILCDDGSNPNAIAESSSLMDGYKMEAFVLNLSFIGWIILGVITCGLGLIFYTNPYMQSTQAVMYDFIRGVKYGTGTYGYGDNNYNNYNDPNNSAYSY